MNQIIFVHFENTRLKCNGLDCKGFSNFSCNLRSYHDWHQAKGFTTFRCLEPLQLIVWKKRLFLGFLRFVRVPPYESWANWTNFYFSCENGDILLSRKSCNLFHTKNEEKSQKISTCIRIPTCVYANTWQGGLIRPPPTLNRVKNQYKITVLYHLSLQSIFMLKKMKIWILY